MTISPVLKDTTERNNAQGAVEQYDIFQNPPQHLVAYVGKLDGSPSGNRRWITTWTGHNIGTIYLGSGWSVFSYIGSRMFQSYATIKGVEYTGRTFGEGMCVVLRETAESKRTREREPQS